MPQLLKRLCDLRKDRNMLARLFTTYDHAAYDPDDRPQLLN